MARDLSGARGAGSYAGISYWLDSLTEPLTPRPRLDGDHDCDVAIIGGGYTGLWTAYYLRQADRSLRVAVIEREICGFGASGRNGGWCSGHLASSWPRIARRSGIEQATKLRRAIEATVDEVGRVAAAESIDCHFQKGGTIEAARTDVQLERARADVEGARAAGVAAEDFELLDATRARAILDADGVLGATYSPHCAAIHPARLARGLVEAAERHGVRIFEQTAVERIEARALRCRGGTVRAGTVVRATEGYTPTLPGFSRDVAPLYSLMIATEPIPPSVWETIGLANRQTFSDYRHLFIYGQRTADGRLAFGGRGAPYHFGSSVFVRHDKDVRVHTALARSLVELFPALQGIEITHRWGGPIGVSRDWYPSVGMDRESGYAWAGGYVGYGVAAANLAGRTLADLIVGRDSDLIELPWVNHHSPRWEPEPLRFVGMNLGLFSMASGDRVEKRTGKPSRRAELFERLLQS